MKLAGYTNIMIFLLKAKIENRLGDIKKHLLGGIILLIGVCYLGVKFGEEINIVDPIEKSYWMRTIGVAMLIAPLLYFFFPSYTNRIKIFLDFHPIKKRQKAFIELFFNFLVPQYIFSLIVLLIIVFMMRFPLEDSLFLVVSFFLIFIIEQNIRVLVENPMRKKLSILCFNLFLIAIYLVLLYRIENQFLSITACLVLILGGVFLHIKSVEAEVKEYFSTLGKPMQIKGRRLKVFYHIALWRQKKFLINFFIGTLLIRVLFLPYYFEEVKSMGSKEYSWAIAVYALLSSAYLFTYIFNNIWGFIDKVYFNIYYSKQKYTAAIRVYLILLVLLMVVDFLYCIIYLALAEKLTFHFIIYYLCSMLLSLVIGLYAAFLRPQTIKKSIAFHTLKGNTSTYCNLLLASLIMGYAFIFHDSTYFYLASASLVTVSIIGLFAFAKIFLRRSFEVLNGALYK